MLESNIRSGQGVRGEGMENGKIEKRESERFIAAGTVRKEYTVKRCGTFNRPSLVYADTMT
jgi:hypothetical protein